MVYVRINLKVKDYTSRVLSVVKDKYGLKDKAQALDKFVELYGDDLVEKPVNEQVIRDVIRSCDEHVRKHGFTPMSLEELRAVCGV